MPRRSLGTNAAVDAVINTPVSVSVSDPAGVSPPLSSIPGKGSGVVGMLGLSCRSCMIYLFQRPSMDSYIICYYLELHGPSNT